MRRDTASLRIQKDTRMYLSRKAYLLLCSSAVTIQTCMRGMAARNELCFRKKTGAAIHIQSQCRRYLAQLYYLRIKKAAIASQCAWRGRVARRELRKLQMAAKETGALQAAKTKLENQVEELTWRLQLEKRMRVDIEEAKTRENVKLQSHLQEMQLQFEEIKELLIKEREAAKLAAEQTPVIQEVPVIDHEMINNLGMENEKLKALVNSLEKKIDETEKKYKETSKLSEERLKQALEAESKIIQLKAAMQRKSSFMQEPQSATPAKKIVTESLRRSQIERQHENVDALIKCVSQDLGFSHGKPIAAFTIYKCLLHWKCFEAERTSVFDRLIQMIGSAIENQDSNEHMAYWLSNISMLLFLLQRTLKSTDATPGKPPAPTSFFGRMTQGFRSSPSSVSLSFRGLEVHQVEAKYPALLFKQQLTAYVEKIYGIVRDNLKNDLSPFVSCIQAPKSSRANVLRSSGQSFGKSSTTNHWKSIVESLNGLLNILKENCVPAILCQKMFTQIFSYINVQLFNSFLLRRECCTFNNGEHVKAGLAELELWCGQVKEEYAGSSWDELKHVRQAVGFLVIHQKSRISYDDITNDLCPILSVQQLYRICTFYWDDNYNTPSVSPEVISSMKVLMAEDSNDADSNSFLLDDNSSIPFSVDDIILSVEEKDFSDVKPAAELIGNPAFEFLQE
ncbi:Myosin-6 [Sarracenia purpurea var. burkii]